MMIVKWKRSTSTNSLYNIEKTCEWMLFKVTNRKMPIRGLSGSVAKKSSG